ncbi:hypothetical protein BGZ47_001478 [Haplosporangium gracile]|nr:hypothetical protein BGZ47_001478 [Haplosporangium gracile]
MHINELLFGTVTQPGGRKTETLVLAKEVSGGELHYIECSKTVLFIHAHGLCGKIYGMRAIEDVYGASAALGKVCLPSNKFEMNDFLSGSSLRILFRYKAHMVEFGEDIL